jgi:Tfp pilus assembly protein PilF
MSAQENAGLRDSLSAATELLAYHPDSIDLRLKKVRWNIQLKQWQYAKDDLDKVLFLDNRNIAGLFYRAYINQQLMRYNFARLDYNNLLTIVPGNFEAQLGLALLNQKDKHHTEAYDQINVLVEAHPDSATAYAARAGIEKDRGMLELAEYDYGKAFELDRKNIDYLINRADIRISLCRMSEARRDLDLATKLGYPRPALTEFYRRLRKK